MIRFCSVCILILFSIGCTAEESCQFKNSFVKEDIPKNEKVSMSYWQTGKDRDSEETVKRLYLVYKNGDMAVIEHKYCEMYNFELSYFSDRYSNVESTKKIGELISSHMIFSAIQPSFNKNLGLIIMRKLEEKGFKTDKDLSVILPDDDVTFDEHVEYGMSYHPKMEGIISSGLNFYMSIGGL